MFNWLTGNKDTPPSNDEGGEQPAEQGVFSGAFSFVKGMFGLENLKVEEAGESSGSGDVEDQDKRKGLFSQLSSYIGKDITSMISLPVWVFEPVSFLQVMSEPLQYEYLLQKADECEDSLDRLAFIAAFNCALYSTAVRTKKPFNPLLGETFEIVTDKFKFLAEQVSHHPPIGVSETRSEHYTLQLETELKSKFYGNSSEVIILGTNHITFAKSGEHITWGHIVTCCHNIILGTMWLDHYGELTIQNHTTGDKCILKFNKSGWLGAGRFTLTGDIVDKDGKVRIKLQGKWNQALYGSRVDADGKLGEEYLIWEAHKEQTNTNKFNFTRFVLDHVINLTPEYEAILPPGDSRLRADRRALEAGDIELAGRSKHEMEEAQRFRKRARDAKSEEWATNYFEKIDDPQFGHLWMFNGKYWDEREERVKKYNESKK